MAVTPEGVGCGWLAVHASVLSLSLPSVTAGVSSKQHINTQLVCRRTKRRKPARCSGRALAPSASGASIAPVIVLDLVVREQPGDVRRHLLQEVVAELLEVRILDR